MYSFFCLFIITICILIYTSICKYVLVLVLIYILINTYMKMIVCIRRRIHVYISNSVMHVRIRLNIGAIII